MKFSRNFIDFGLDAFMTLMIISHEQTPYAAIAICLAIIFLWIFMKNLFPLNQAGIYFATQALLCLLIYSLLTQFVFDVAGSISGEG